MILDFWAKLSRPRQGLSQAYNCISFLHRTTADHTWRKNGTKSPELQMYANWTHNFRRCCGKGMTKAELYLNFNRKLKSFDVIFHSPSSFLTQEHQQNLNIAKPKTILSLNNTGWISGGLQVFETAPKNEIFLLLLEACKKWNFEHTWIVWRLVTYTSPSARLWSLDVRVWLKLALQWGPIRGQESW